MPLLLVCVAILALICWLIIWAWLIFGIRKNGYRKAAGLVSVQIATIAVIYGLLRGGIEAGLFLILFPFWVFLEFDRLVLFFQIINRDLLYVVSLTLLALILFVSFKKTRIWAFGAACGALLFSTIVAAELNSRRQICMAAERYGVTAVHRNNILWSIKNAGAEWQWGFHAAIDVEDKSLAWSYQAMDWYEVPATVGATKPRHILTCR